MSRRTSHLSQMARDEVKDWHECLVVVPGMLIVSILLIVSPYLVLMDTPYWWAGELLGVGLAVMIWFFSWLIFMVSYPLSVKKVNGRWVEKP